MKKLINIKKLKLTKLSKATNLYLSPLASNTEAEIFRFGVTEIDRRIVGELSAENLFLKTIHFKSCSIHRLKSIKLRFLHHKLNDLISSKRMVSLFVTNSSVHQKTFFLQQISIKPFVPNLLVPYTHYSSLYFTSIWRSTIQ